MLQQSASLPVMRLRADEAVIATSVYVKGANATATLAVVSAGTPGLLAAGASSFRFRLVRQPDTDQRQPDAGQPNARQRHARETRAEYFQRLASCGGLGHLFR